MKIFKKNNIFNIIIYVIFFFILVSIAAIPIFPIIQAELIATKSYIGKMPGG